MVRYFKHEFKVTFRLISFFSKIYVFFSFDNKKPTESCGSRVRGCIQMVFINTVLKDWEQIH